MKTLSALVVCCIFSAGLGVAKAEPPKESEREQQLAALVREVQTQQAAITDNQAKIDAKLATIAEAVRQAKIFASRSGR